MTKLTRDIPKEPEQEPVAWLAGRWQWVYFDLNRAKEEIQVEGGELIPLYTTPPQRKPLTDENAAAIAYKGFNDYWTEDCKGSDVEAWTAAARAIEAAHGIKENT